MNNDNREPASRTKLLAALRLAIACVVALSLSEAVGAQTDSPHTDSNSRPQSGTFSEKYDALSAADKALVEKLLAHQPKRRFKSEDSSSKREDITTNAVVVGDNKKFAPPATAEQFMKNLHDVISHGDLGDVQYYANEFGFVLQGSNIGQFYQWGPVCGKLKTDTMGQYFNNLSVPWYADEKQRFDNRCGQYPYEREFLKNGFISAGGPIYINTSKMCITNTELDNLFKDMNFTHGPNNRSFVYQFNEMNSIEVYAIPLGDKNCIGVISLIQNVTDNTK